MHSSPQAPTGMQDSAVTAGSIHTVTVQHGSLKLYLHLLRLHFTIQQAASVFHILEIPHYKIMSHRPVILTACL